MIDRGSERRAGAECRTQVVAPKRSWLSKRLPVIGCGLCTALLAAELVFYFVNPLPAAVSSVPTIMMPPRIAYPIMPIQAPPPSIHSATRAALLSAGVDKNKVVALFRHQRPPVDLSHLEAIARRSEWLAMEAERR
jgi:hypothetical protein